MEDFFKICGVSKQLYKEYLKKKSEYFREVREPNDEDKEEIFSKREIKTLTRANRAYVNLVYRLIEEEYITRSKIASL